VQIHQNKMIFVLSVLLPHVLALNLKHNSFYSKSGDEFDLLRADLALPIIHSALNATRSSETSLTASLDESTMMLYFNEQSSSSHTGIANLNVSFTFDTTGWNIVSGEVENLRSAPMYALGYMEGFTTAIEITKFYELTSKQTCRNPQFRSWLSTRYSSMIHRFRTASTFPPGCDRFYSSAQAFYSQLFGMLDGHNAYYSSHPSNQLDYFDLLCMNSEAQLSELFQLFSHSGPLPSRERCSAIVARDQFGGIIVSHSTWNTPEEMINRNFKFLKSRFEKLNIQMSSYPGFVSSTDDWTLKPDSFLITETSISGELTEATNAKMPDFLRIISAFAASSSGQGWIDNFTKCDAPTGTYLSQWIIVDFERDSISSLAPGEAAIDRRINEGGKMGSFNGKINEGEEGREEAFRNWDSAPSLESIFRLMEENPAFSIVPRRGSTGDADWKLTATGLGGTVVRAGPSAVDSQERTVLIDYLESLEPSSHLDSAPILYMKDGVSRPHGSDTHLFD
jgi:hypothetical protein